MKFEEEKIASFFVLFLTHMKNVNLCVISVASQLIVWHSKNLTLQFSWTL